MDEPYLDQFEDFRRFGRIYYDISSIPTFIPSKETLTESSVCFNQFSLLDEVFTGFIETNYYKQEHYTFDNLLKYNLQAFTI
jgi:hypothetical protein